MAEHDFTVFKLKLKDKLKPHKFKHFNCGFRYPNTLHTQLRVGRSFLNSHMFELSYVLSVDISMSQQSTIYWTVQPMLTSEFSCF